MPHAFKRHLFNLLPTPLNFAKPSVVFVTYNKNLLPQILNSEGKPTEKSFSVPSNLKVQKMIDFIFHDQKMKDYILVADKERANPQEYLELCLESKIVNEETQELELIVLDIELSVHTVLNCLWYSLHPSNYKAKDPSMRILYRRRQGLGAAINNS